MQVCVSISIQFPQNMYCKPFYRLLQQGEAILLYPGGVSEALKRRGEDYSLQWPMRPEFIRLAARFNATIVPLSAIGVDDSLSVILD